MQRSSEQAIVDLEHARGLRASGTPCREIGRTLRLSSSQLGHIRRTLKREKPARTRLRSSKPDATDRDLPVSRSALPSGLRELLTSSGYLTFGNFAERFAEPDFPGLETMPGIGPHRAGLVRGLLARFGLLPGSSDLQAAVERLFPEFCDAPETTQTPDIRSLHEETLPVRKRSRSDSPITGY